VNREGDPSLYADRQDRLTWAAQPSTSTVAERSPNYSWGVAANRLFQGDIQPVCSFGPRSYSHNLKPNIGQPDEIIDGKDNGCVGITKRLISTPSVESELPPRYLVIGDN
jgi:hypothetical protein